MPTNRSPQEKVFDPHQFWTPATWPQVVQCFPSLIHRGTKRATLWPTGPSTTFPHPYRCRQPVRKCLGPSRDLLRRTSNSSQDMPNTLLPFCAAFERNRTIVVQNGEIFPTSPIVSNEPVRSKACGGLFANQRGMRWSLGSLINIAAQESPVSTL